MLAMNITFYQKKVNHISDFTESYHPVKFWFQRELWSTAMQEIYSCLCNINSLLCFTNKYLTLFIVAIHTVKRLHFSTYFAAIRGQRDINHG